MKMTNQKSLLKLKVPCLHFNFLTSVRCNNGTISSFSFVVVDTRYVRVDLFLMCLITVLMSD